MIDLDLFRAFAAIHRAGSLTAATRLLGLSQAAISVRLQALEALTGEPLFQRHRFGVTPTAAGKRLAERVLPLINELETIFSEVSGRTSSRPFRLGGPAPFCTRRLLPCFDPQWGTIEFHFGLTEPLLRDLTAGNLDAVIATHRIRSSSLTFEPIEQESFVLVAAPAWIERHPDPAHSAPASLLAFAEQLPMIRRYFESRPERPSPPILIAPDLLALQAAAEAGLGATVLPAYLCAESLREGRLCDLHPEHTKPTNTLFLVLPRGQRRPPFLQAWLERLSTIGSPIP